MHASLACVALLSVTRFVTGAEDIGAPHTVHASVTVAGHAQIDSFEVKIHPFTSKKDWLKALGESLRSTEGASAFNTADSFAVRFIDDDGVLNAVCSDSSNVHAYCVMAGVGAQLEI